MHSIIDIAEFYERAEASFKENKFELAASYYKTCWDLYQNSEDVLALPSVSDLAYDAFDKYNELIKEKKLDESGFDLLEYEV